MRVSRAFCGTALSWFIVASGGCGGSTKRNASTGGTGGSPNAAGGVGAGGQNGECLFAALRDRTVGRYKYVATYSDIGSSTNELLLLVSADGTVLLSGANEDAGSVVHRS